MDRQTDIRTGESRPNTLSEYSESVNSDDSRSQTLCATQRQRNIDEIGRGVGLAIDVDGEVTILASGDLFNGSSYLEL